MRKRYWLNLIWVLMVFVMVASPVLAYVYQSTITITNNTATNYSMVSVNGTLNTEYLASAGYFTENATDVQIKQGATVIPRLLSDNAVYLADDLAAFSTKQYTLSTNNSREDFTNTFGYGSYVTVADNATQELGDNFTASVTAYVNTDNGADKFLIGKGLTADDPFSVFVSPTVSGNITARVGDGASANASSFNTVDNTAAIYKPNSFGQSFVSDTQFVVNAANLTLQEVGGGANGTLHVQITTANADGTPNTSDNVSTGSRAAWGISGGSADYTVNLTPFVKAANTTYCMYAWTTDGNAANNISFDQDAAGGTYPYFGILSADFVNFSLYGVGANRFECELKGHELTEVSATGVSSGEHNTVVGMDSPFYGIEIDPTDFVLGVTDNLTMNTQLWDEQANSTPFTTIDSNAYSIAVTGANWSSDGYVFGGAQYLKHTAADWRSSDYQGTFVSWFKTSDKTASREVFNTANEGTATEYWYVGILSGSGRMRVATRSAASGVGATEVAGTADVSDDLWHQLIIRSDGNTWDFRLDDAVDAISGGVNTGNWFGDITLRDNFSIGARIRAATDQYWNGTIGEIQIYDKYLTDAECSQLYNATKWKYDGTIDRMMMSTLSSVPDTSDNWTFQYNGGAEKTWMPYSTDIGVWISDNGTTPNAISFPGPDSYIRNTVLPNEALSGDPGVISWGSNPAGIDFVIGALAPEGISPVTLEPEVPGVVGEYNPGANMFGGNATANTQNPLYTIANAIESSVSGVAIEYIWIHMCLVSMTLLFVAAYRYIKHLLVAGALAIMVVGFFVSMDIGIPDWILYYDVIGLIGIVAAEKARTI